MIQSFLRYIVGCLYLKNITVTISWTKEWYYAIFPVFSHCFAWSSSAKYIRNFANAGRKPSFWYFTF